MPAPTFRHYRAVSAASNAFFEIHAAVPAGRALIISKITTSNQDGGPHSVSFAIAVLSNESSGFLMNGVPLGAGESFTETGLVVLAGERTYARTSSAVVGGLVVNVFGQEVDN